MIHINPLTVFGRVVMHINVLYGKSVVSAICSVARLTSYRGDGLELHQPLRVKDSPQLDLEICAMDNCIESQIATTTAHATL